MKFLHTVVAVVLCFGASAASAGICRTALVPAYYGPDTTRCTGWGSFATHTPMQWIVANPANGVGSAPTYECQYEIAYALQAGLEVAGYISTGYGTRPIEEIKEEMFRWATWYCVTGFFFDEANSNKAWIGYYQELADYAALILPYARVFLNHGNYPAEAFARLRERNHIQVTLVTFEGQADAYQGMVEPLWVAKYSPFKFAHIVYDAGYEELALTLAKAATHNAQYVFVTDDFQSWDGQKWDLNPWDVIPSYWYDLVAGLNCQ